jgi:hypothetical protein
MAFQSMPDDTEPEGFSIPLCAQYLDIHNYDPLLFKIDSALS